MVVFACLGVGDILAPERHRREEGKGQCVWEGNLGHRSPVPKASVSLPQF